VHTMDVTSKWYVAKQPKNPVQSAGFEFQAKLVARICKELSMNRFTRVHAYAFLN